MDTKLTNAMVAAALGLALVGCDAEVEQAGDIDLPETRQTEEGNFELPSVDVDVKGGDVDLPEYETTGGNLEMPKVDVDAPDVDVDAGALPEVRVEGGRMPGIDVDPAGEGDADEVEEPNVLNGREGDTRANDQVPDAGM